MNKSRKPGLASPAEPWAPSDKAMATSLCVDGDSGQECKEWSGCVQRVPDTVCSLEDRWHWAVVGMNYPRALQFPSFPQLLRTKEPIGDFQFSPLAGDVSGIIPLVGIPKARYSCVRTLTKNPFRKASTYLTFRLLSIMKGSQGRKPSRNERAGSEAEAMVKHSLLACSTFLTPLQTTTPGMALPTIVCTNPQRGLMKKMLHRLAYRPMWHFSQLMFLLPSLPLFVSS